MECEMVVHPRVKNMYSEVFAQVHALDEQLLFAATNSGNLLAYEWVHNPLFFYW